MTAFSRHDDETLVFSVVGLLTPSSGLLVGDQRDYTRLSSACKSLFHRGTGLQLLQSRHLLSNILISMSLQPGLSSAHLFIRKCMKEHWSLKSIDVENLNQWLNELEKINFYMLQLLHAVQVTHSSLTIIHINVIQWICTSEWTSADTWHAA